MKSTCFFVAICCFVLMSQLSFAQQGIIQGRVIDFESKEAVPFAFVNLDNDRAVNTNQNGEFSFTELAPGNYQLTVSFIGFETMLLSGFEVKENQKPITVPVIELKPKPVHIDEVSVRYPRVSFSDKFSGSNHIISNRILQLQQPLGSEEVLRTVPGVNVAGDMGISNRLNVGIRGSYPRRSDKILILEDGTPVAPAPYLAPSAYYNPPSDRIDGIEIIKGADVLTYGPNTMYGVINYITKLPPAKPTFKVSLSGGNHRHISNLVSYGGTWKNVGAEIQVLNKTFGGFQDNSKSKIFNTTAKLFADLGEKQSLYLKLNFHKENSQATYSSLTPFTFRIAPEENPFDADDLITTRLAMDAIHNVQLSEKVVLGSKIYLSQFTRDWWRQNNTLINANTAREYLGDEIYFDRFGYMEGQTFTENDYVRVGTLTDGHESTKARNRTFKVFGVQESMKLNSGGDKVSNQFEAGIRFHSEKFFNREITGDSSRFARSGEIVKDQKYLLYAGSLYAKNSFKFQNLQISPTLRFEYISLNNQNLLAIADNPQNNGDKDFLRIENNFYELIPGMSVNYKVRESEQSVLSIFGGVYKGYTPPTSSVGFLSIENNEVSKPDEDQEINMRPERSLNFELGFRGFAVDNAINGQVTYFNNSIKDFYSAGRKEAFQTLGSVNIQGIEIGGTVDLTHFAKVDKHSLKLSASSTWLRSRITGGKLKDADIFKAKHTQETKAELIQKINEERNGYSIFFKDIDGNDSLVSGNLTDNDFDNISSLEMKFGEDGISQNHAPYVPKYLVNIRLDYTFKGFSTGLNFNLVGEQFTDYLNMNHETAEGAIGKLSAYTAVDANIQYNFSHPKDSSRDFVSIFIAGKNLTNQVYKASRLHRVSSGIFPGGFRQINFGFRFSY